MSVESRSCTALQKREEQLKRWHASDTNTDAGGARDRRPPRVKFSSGCVFLAACSAGDKDEVLRLLEAGADVDTANVDGLTALHQACIDDNIDMVEFLVEQGADVNRGDNEGWTPLHATASCGFLYVARYLIDKGSDVAAVNNDGELPLDIAECSKMEDLLREEIQKRGIDCDAARNFEEISMMRDAEEWLTQKSPPVNVTHPKTGATPLHVAAAKGYTEVMKVLFQCGADVDAQDVDGWTPMHAAAHWGQNDACQILAENLADMDAKNYVGQTPFDLCDSDMVPFLDDLKKKQNKEDVNKRKAIKRVESEDRPKDIDTLPKIPKKVEVEITETKNNENIGMEVSSESESETESETESSSDSASDSELESAKDKDEKKNQVNAALSMNDVAQKDTEPSKPPLPPRQVIENKEDSAPWRKLPVLPPKTEQNSPVKSTGSFRDIKNSENNETEVTLRRTNSFLSDEEFRTRYMALHARIQAYKDSDTITYRRPAADQIPQTHSPRPHSEIILSASNRRPTCYSSSKEEKNDSSNTTSSNTSPSKISSPAQSPQPNNQQQPFRSGLKLIIPNAANGTPAVSGNSGNGSPTPTTSTPTTPGGTRFQVFKNFFKSFVPPVRDEESETQRKAHAKRVRETRRSTQGVTLEEIKSAEQFVKMKNQPNSNETSGGNAESPGTPTVTVTATITTATPTVVARETTDDQPVVQERRPSWRLKVDGGSKFKLEDASKPPEHAEPAPTTPSFARRTSATTTPRPSSAPTGTETADTTVTLPLRRPRSMEDKEQDKENDAKSAQATLATQAAIQRRRRPKRRSTGVVSFDNMDDLDSEKDPAAGGDNASDASKLNSQESGTERSSRSRVGSTVDIRNENGEIDYKKLYEQQLTENDRLKDKLRKQDEELRDTKQTLERLNVVTSKNSLSELEKRERRAMERKLSEMEEELKQLQKLKAENERLKADNRSLTRVINKLTNSAKK